MKDTVFILEIMVGFTFVFTILWSGIVYMVSQASGWRHLATKYQTSPLKEGYYGGVYGRMGIANYNGVLRVAFVEQGMYLHVMPLFKIGHPPLLLPWNQLKNWEEGNLFFQKTIKWKIEGINIVLPHKYLGTIQSYLSAYT